MDQMEYKKKPGDECKFSDEAVAIRKAEIPGFLHRSEFFQSLEDSEEDVLVPQTCFKLNDQVTCGEDLHRLLLTLRFWIADPMIKSVVEYAFTSPFEVVEPIIAEFYSDFPVLRKIGAIRFAQKSMELAIESGCFTIVNYLARTGHSWPQDAVRRIVKKGNLDMLKLALETGCTLKGDECSTAAMNGHLHCMKYLREEHHCPWDENTTHQAVRNGSVDCLRYAHENGCPWRTQQDWRFGVDEGLQDICTLAVTLGRLDCLKYVHRKGVLFHPDVLIKAVDIECIKYARDHGAAWSKNLYHSAIVADSPALLRYLFENGCPWHGISECTAAVRYKRFHCLQLLHEFGCPWGAETCEAAAQINDTDVLLYLLRNDCPVCPNLWGMKPSDAFAEVVQCFLSKGLTWDLTPNATLCCIQNDNFRGLELLIQNGCPWHPSSFSFTQMDGNFAMFKWVHELGAPWEDTCLSLAYRGSIDWLKYAHTHGAMIPPETCEVIMKRGRWSPKLVECFKYAHQFGGCELRKEYAMFEVHDGGEELWSYLKSQGCVLW